MTMTITIEIERPGRPAERHAPADHASALTILHALGIRRDASATLVRRAARYGHPQSRTLATGTVVTVAIEVTR